MIRCNWCDEKDALYIAYHDKEWGLPVHDDLLLFEMLILESFVAGLSWQCVLHKRNAFKRAYDNFNPQTVAKYDEDKISLLKADPDLIRHEGKIRAAVTNAKVFRNIQTEFGSFDKYLWHWTNGKTLQSDGKETKSALSDKISKDLRTKGMKFIGSTTVFAYLCAVGVINAHQKNCFKLALK